VGEPVSDQLGCTIVAPREHRTEVSGDFALEEYLVLQRVVHRVGEAVRRAVPTERLYLLSLGSGDRNAHVHWHLVPHPPDVPYEEQQLAALDWERDGVLDLSAVELEELAASIRAHLGHS
jgi:diadenosine tetraphosphate (Ap4A) HIT family hydrolase